MEIKVASMIDEYLETIGYLEYDFDGNIGGTIYKHKKTGKKVMVLVEDVEEDEK